MAVLTKITSRTLADNSVTSAKIQAGAVAAADVGTNAITAVELADDAVDTAAIADDAITSALIADDAVGAAALASNAVVNASIASGAAIALDKLATSTASRVLETSGTGVITPSSVTTTTLGLLDISSSLQTHLNNLQIQNLSLSLKIAVQENKMAYNTKDSFIDQFEDESKITSKTNCSYRPTGLGELLSTATWTADARGTFAVQGAASKSGYPLPIDKTDSRFGISCYNGAQNAGATTNDTCITSSDFTTAIRQQTGESWTAEWWFKNGTLVQNSSQRMVMLGSGPSHTGGDGTPQMSFGYNDVDRFNTYGSMSAANNNQTWDVTTRGDEPDKWHHFCFQKYSSNMGMIWIDGQAQNVGDFGSNNNYAGTVPGGQTGAQHIGIGYRTGNANEMYRGKIDEFRFSNLLRYDPISGVDDFDPPDQPFVADVNTMCLIHFDESPPKDWSQVATKSGYNATGSFTNTTNTVTGSRDRVSITLLYKNAGSSVATLNTHLKAEVSANGGSNWTTCVLVAGGTMNTNRSHQTGTQALLMASAANVTVTAGTDVRYRISWTGQDAAQYTEVHGVALMY